MRSHCQAEEQGAFNTIKVVRILLQRGSHLDLLLTSLSEAGTLSPWQAGFVFLSGFVEAAVSGPLPSPTPPRLPLGRGCVPEPPAGRS